MVGPEKNSGVVMTTNEVCEYFGVSPRTVQNWVIAGLPVKEQGGAGKSRMFYSAEVLYWKLRRDIKERIGYVPAETELRIERDMLDTKIEKLQKENTRLTEQLAHY